MKNLAIVFVLSILACAVVGEAREENLYNMFKDKTEVKVFLKDVINETGGQEVDIGLFRRMFTDTLEKRKEVRLVPVDNENTADVAIIAKIKNYTFTKNAMPRPFGAATLIADALSAKSAGNMTVDYLVKRPFDGSTLLDYRSFATETRRPQKDMEGMRGYSYTVIKNADTFVHKAFCKPHAK